MVFKLNMVTLVIAFFVGAAITTMVGLLIYSNKIQTSEVAEVVKTAKPIGPAQVHKSIPLVEGCDRIHYARTKSKAPNTMFIRCVTKGGWVFLTAINWKETVMSKPVPVRNGY